MPSRAARYVFPKMMDCRDMTTKAIAQIIERTDKHPHVRRAILVAASQYPRHRIDLDKRGRRAGILDCVHKALKIA
jgi:hypothetical protein